MIATAIAPVTFVDVISAVSSVGFPIVMCILMFRQFNSLNDKMLNSTKELEEKLQENTIAIVELKDEIHAHGKID